MQSDANLRRSLILLPCVPRQRPRIVSPESGKVYGSAERKLNRCLNGTSCAEDLAAVGALVLSESHKWGRDPIEMAGGFDTIRIEQEIR